MKNVIFPTKSPVMLLVASFFISGQTVFADDSSTLKRSVLLENKVSLESNNINAKTIRVSFPPLFKTPAHTHEGPGPRYIVKGKLKVKEGGKTNIYQAGDVFWESGKQMTVENMTAETAELIIFELAPAKK